MKLYTKSNCNKCKEIKEKLDKKNIKYDEDDYMNCIDEIRDYLKINKNALLPLIKFDDEKIVSNDEGLLKELKKRKIL